MKTQRSLAVARSIGPLCLVVVLLPGCVLQDIHDELVATRAGVERLEELAPALKQSTAALDRSNIELERLYGETVEAHGSLKLVLAGLERSNDQLEEAVRQARHLDPLMVSLKSLDESLAAMRKTIENIDKAIPLLRLTQGTPPADRLLKRQADAKEDRDTPPGTPSR